MPFYYVTFSTTPSPSEGSQPRDVRSGCTETGRAALRGRAQTCTFTRRGSTGSSSRRLVLRLRVATRGGRRCSARSGAKWGELLRRRGLLDLWLEPSNSWRVVRWSRRTLAASGKATPGYGAPLAGLVDGPFKMYTAIATTSASKSGSSNRAGFSSAADRITPITARVATKSRVASIGG